MLRESFEAAEQMPENQVPVKKFALKEAWRILMDASVVDPIAEISDITLMPVNKRDTIEISGSSLRAIRQEKHLSQRALVDSLHGMLTNGYISRIERMNPARVSRVSAARLAEALGKKIEDLVFREDTSIPKAE